MLTKLLSVGVQFATNTNNTVYAAQPAPGEHKLVGLYFVPDSNGAVAIDGTNYLTVTVYQGSTALGTFTTFTGGTALVAGTAVPITLSGGTALEFGQGDILKIDSVKTGSGAVLKGEFTAAFELLRS